MKQRGRVYVCDLAGTEPAGDIYYANYQKVNFDDGSFEYKLLGKFIHSYVVVVHSNSNSSDSFGYIENYILILTFIYMYILNFIIHTIWFI